MKTLEVLAKICAVLAGVLLTTITLMTCVSLIGRNTTGWTIVGDVEISGFVAGAAIALFLPWCQFQRGNIIVDFFTARASIATSSAAGGGNRAAQSASMMTWQVAQDSTPPQSAAMPCTPAATAARIRLWPHFTCSGMALPSAACS